MTYHIIYYIVNDSSGLLLLITTKSKLAHITGRSKDINHFSQKYIWGRVKQCLQGCLPFHLIFFFLPLFFFSMDSKLAVSSPELTASSYKEEKNPVSSSSNYVPRRMGGTLGKWDAYSYSPEASLVWSL